MNGNQKSYLNGQYALTYDPWNRLTSDGIDTYYYDTANRRVQEGQNVYFYGPDGKVMTKFTYNNGPGLIWLEDRVYMGNLYLGALSSAEQIGYAGYPVVTAPLSDMVGSTSPKYPYEGRSETPRCRTRWTSRRT